MDSIIILTVLGALCLSLFGAAIYTAVKNR